MTEFSRSEVEEAFRHYFLTGIVQEDWIAWSKLFTDDATYYDHYYGVFNGPLEIQKFLESTMSFAPHVYSALVWYGIEGDRVVYKLYNRADNPEAGGPPIEFPSLQVIHYAGNGKWASEEDWWILSEMKAFNKEYELQAQKFDPGHKEKRTRLNWGEWVDWARPAEGVSHTPSWFDGQGVRSDVPKVASIKDMSFGRR